MRKLSSPRSIARGLLFVLSLTVLASIPFGCNLSSSAETHRIGHLAPRTGPDGAAGIRLGDAVALAVESFNQENPGVINGRAITVVHSDTGPDLDGFTFQATRLLAVNRVEALLGATNTAQLAKCVGPVQTNEIVLVTPSSALVGPPSKLIWAVGLPSPMRGKWLAQYAAGPMKIADVTVVADQSNPTFVAIRDGFTAEFRHPDRHVSNEWTFGPWKNANEASELADKVKALGPKAILFCGRGIDLLQFRSAIRAAGLPESIPVLFGGEEEESTLRQEPQNSDGIVFVSAFTNLDESEKVKAFCNEFRSRTGQLPGADDALSADSARILFAAALKAQSFKAKGQPTNLGDKLAKFEIELPTGAFAFSDDGVAQRTAYVMQIQSGLVRLLKTCRPEKQ